MSKKALLQNDPGGVSRLSSRPPSINCSNFTRPWACQQVSPPFKLQTPCPPCPCTFPPPLFLSLFTIALPRITFAHGTSPFTQEQFKAGRAGEDKGWNGHGLKVELSINFSSLDICPGNSHSYRLQKFRFLSVKSIHNFGTFTDSHPFLFKELFLHCWRVGLVEQGATGLLLDQVKQFSKKCSRGHC